MKKVLIISTVGLDYQGITSVILNYSSHICLDGLKLEFVAFEGVDSKLKKKYEKIHFCKYTATAHMDDRL